MSQSYSKALKKARAKFLSYSLSKGLATHNPDSSNVKAYWNSFHCCEYLYQEGNTITSRYCKNRWCAICNRIRTAKLINGYMPAIESMADRWFVTLTCRTVNEEDLPGRIDYMNSAIRGIFNSRKGRKMKIRGIRKLECTLRPNQLYHPHFHLVIEGEEAARFIIDSWLSVNGDLSGIDGQDMRRADENSLKEMFKYFTKIASKTGEIINYKRLDVVFRAMRGKRVYQPVGGIKPVSEDTEGTMSEEYEHLEYRVSMRWKWASTDWFNELGEALTGYKPTEKFESLFKYNENKCVSN